MAVKTLDELMGVIKEHIGEDTSDNTISFLEDVTDTFNDYNTRLSDTTDWKAKYEENDKNWRERYTARFYSSNEQNDKDKSEYDKRQPVVLEYEDLFEEVKE